jgi:uncharacterized protein (DUF1778 family)
MAHAARQEARLEARVRPELKALIEEAAGLQGRTLTDFVTRSAEVEARRIVEEHRHITLREEHSRAFAEALLNPPAPNATLLAAARRHSEPAPVAMA